MPSPGSVASSQNTQSDNSSYPQCESSDLSGNYFPYSGHQHSSRHPAKQDFFGEVTSRRRHYIQRQPRCTRIFQHKKNGDIDLGYKYKVLKNVLKLYRKNFLHRSRSFDNMEQRQLPTRPEKHSKLQASCLSSSSWSDTLDDEPTSQSKKTNKFNHQMPKFSPSAERLLCQMCSPCRKRTIRWGLGDKDLPITKTAFHELKNETNDSEAHHDRLFDAETLPGSSGLQDNQCCPLCKRRPNTLITTLDILKGISRTVSSRKDEEGCWRPNSPTSLNPCSPTCGTPRDEERQAYDPCCASMEKEAQEAFCEAKDIPTTFQPFEQTPDIKRYAELKRRLDSLKSKQTSGLRSHDKRKRTRKRDGNQSPNVRKNKHTKSLAKGSGLAKYSSGLTKYGSALTKYGSALTKYGSGMTKYGSGMTKYGSAPNTLMGMPSKLSPEYFNKSGLIEKKSSSAAFPGSSPRLNDVTGTGFKSIVTVDHFESFNLNKFAIHNPATAVHPRNISNNVDFYKQNKTLLQGSENAEPIFGSVQAASPQCSNYVQNKIDELKLFIAASSGTKREHPVSMDETKCLVELKPVGPRRLASTSESSADFEQPSPPSPKNVHTAHPITLLQDLVRDNPKSQSASKAEEEVPASPVEDAAGKQCSDHTLAASKKQDAVVQCELKRSRLRTPKKNLEESPNSRAILIILNNGSKKERNESQNRKSRLKNMNVLGQIDNGPDTKMLENGQSEPPEKRPQGACSSASKCQNVINPDASKAEFKVEELDVIYKSAEERNSSLSGEEAWHNSVPNNGNPEDDDLRTEAIDTDISFL
ncbi:unnamed protein product [Lymnaea stagnalis]|uniref:Uncharacterized protein n=1 Tax=Lymnaea stagnalis TaxID=6523 RepID=A0AAV2H7I4_LYMST